MLCVCLCNHRNKWHVDCSCVTHMTAGYYNMICKYVSCTQEPLALQFNLLHKIDTKNYRRNWNGNCKHRKSVKPAQWWSTSGQCWEIKEVYCLPVVLCVMKKLLLCVSSALMCNSVYEIFVDAAAVRWRACSNTVQKNQM